MPPIAAADAGASVPAAGSKASGVSAPSATARACRLYGTALSGRRGSSSGSSLDPEPEEPDPEPPRTGPVRVALRRPDAWARDDAARDEIEVRCDGMLVRSVRLVGGRYDGTQFRHADLPDAILVGPGRVRYEVVRDPDSGETLCYAWIDPDGGA